MPAGTLLWMAPALSGGGYSSEALAFAQGLAASAWGRRSFGLKQFAEPQDDDFVAGLVLSTARQRLQDLLVRGMEPRLESGVVVCHSTPDAWVPSKFPGWDSIAPCPPPQAKYAIGRTMYETSSVPDEWVERCNRMDEIWVPTAFHAESFARAGVIAEKIVIVGEPVDTAFFDPAKVKPLALDVTEEDARRVGGAPFRFLSVFKWEQRKGWDALLAAYYAEFGAEERVELVLKTKPFYSSGDFEGLIEEFAAARALPSRRAARTPC